MDKREFLVDSFKKFGHELTDVQIEQFLTYAEMLVEWNEKMNLTAITEFEDIVWKHFIDSVAVMQSETKDLSDFEGTMIDVGTGAGFPGVPLKIMFPKMKVTLLDSLNKRIGFLQAVVDQCQLENVELVHGRAEDFGKNPEYREQFDLCVSRAVANLSTLSEYCVPFLKIGATFISYKSSDIEEEMNNSKKAIKTLGAKTFKVETFTIKGTDIPRSLVFMEKIGKTPKQYPRKAGTPSKNPL